MHSYKAHCHFMRRWWTPYSVGKNGRRHEQGCYGLTGLPSLPPSLQAELDNVSALLEESEKKGMKLAKEVDKLSSKLQDLEVTPSCSLTLNPSRIRSQRKKPSRTPNERMRSLTLGHLRATCRSCGKRRRGRS